VCRSVGVVFDLCNTARNAGLVTLKINDPVMPLMAAAAAPDRDPAIIIAARDPLFWL
jgi:hypothetical protein